MIPAFILSSPLKGLKKRACFYLKYRINKREYKAGIGEKGRFTKQLFALYGESRN